MEAYSARTGPCHGEDGSNGGEEQGEVNGEPWHQAEIDHEYICINPEVMTPDILPTKLLAAQHTLLKLLHKNILIFINIKST